MNLVLFLTMIFLLFGRLPDYSDEGEEGEERNKRAKFMFYGLLLYHLGIGAVRYLS